MKSKLLSSTFISLLFGAGIAAAGVAITASPGYAAASPNQHMSVLPAAKARSGSVQVAACNPCASASKCADAAMKTASACNPCAAKNPCSAKKVAAACNPCAAKKVAANPCAAKNVACN